jgi:broad specificity phosphatase PhoE
VSATRLLVVRHAESEWNAAGRWQGQADPPLSEGGLAEAQEAAGRLACAGYAFAAVVSSDLQRARHTAQILSEAIRCPRVEVAEGLREIDVGGWSGLTRAQIAERFPDETAAYREGRLEAFPGGESRADHLTRVLGAIEALVEAHGGEQLLVVTHGGVISGLERHLGVFPGRGVRPLGGRWFEHAGELRVGGDRLSLADGEGLPAPESS